jgi:hypothetical protein
MDFSLKAHVLWRQLGQTVRIGDFLMYEKAAPTAFYRVEMFPVEGNARADDLHVTRTVVPHRLARAKWDAVLVLQHHFLLKQKILQLDIGRELEAHRPDDLIEEVMKCVFP